MKVIEGMAIGVVSIIAFGMFTYFTVAVTSFIISAGYSVIKAMVG